VTQAAWISAPPLGITFPRAEVAPDDRPTDPDWRPPTVYTADVSSDYFVTARVPVVEGRAFDDRDNAESAPVVIVNEALAKQFWPDRSPIGRHLTADGASLDVVGVVRNGKYQDVWETPRGMIFRPLAQGRPPFATLVVRASRSSSELAPAVREAIRHVDPDVALYDVRPMSVHLDNGAFSLFRVGAFITSVFGGMGMLLASIGLYGVIAYHVSQRTNEIGVRMALGARAADIIRDVLLRGGRYALIGTAIGVLLAGALAQMLRTLLVGVSPFDPLTYTGVVILLLAVTLLASFVPARSATALNPLVALRSD
jgi:predicted permease